VETAIKQSTYQAVVIATPAPHHVPIVTLFAEQDCHLLIEKPLSTALERIDILCQLVAERSLVAYVQRAHPALQAVKKFIDSDRYGRPLQIKVIMGHPFAHYRPAYREIYFAQRQEGGGAIQDAMTHYYNSVEWLVGPISRLVTDAAHLSLDGVVLEDTVHTLARHGEVLASYTINMYEPSNEMTITIVCESGTLRSDLKRCRWSQITQPDTD